MFWVQSLDIAIFRFVNQKLSNPIFDAVMPLFAGNPLFVCAVIVLAVLLLWRGGVRGRAFVIVLTVTLALGDGLVINTVKKAVARPRPPVTLDGVHLLVGKGSSGAMPSSHTSTWFAATLIAFAYYRKSWRFMLPLATAQGFSRIYLGVHHPSDVLAGAIIGAGYGAAGLWSLNALWQWLGRVWFASWWRRLPSLIALPDRLASETNPIAGSPAVAASGDRSYLRLGYFLIAALFVVRLWYIASGRIELSEDEAYQWLWSKHLALSYYSKPPMIAWLQFLGTSLWGDSELGARFFSPVIAAVLSWIVLRFMARQVNAQAAFWTLVVITCAPLLAVGATLMTVDPPLVLFWTLALVLGWRAVQTDSSAKHWLAVGLAMGLAFLSKYTAILQIVCFALFFLLWKPARQQLRRSGPCLALLVFALCTVPVIVWNAQHGWITISHVGENAKLNKPWHPTLKYFFEFVGAEAGLLNPIFFTAALWAMVAFWKRDRANPRLLYFFSMGAPVFLGYWIYTLHSRVLPNWIAPAVLPMFCLMVAYWDGRWRGGFRTIKPWLATGAALGAAAVVLLHDTRLIGKFTGRRLPPKIDPHRRVHGWKETAYLADAARQRLRSDGSEVFIVCSHYGLTGQISFYLPEAREAVRKLPLVYYRSSPRPRNQFYFWSGYRKQRRGQNAIYVDEVELPKLVSGWFWAWLGGKRDLYEPNKPPSQRLPPEMLAEFESVVDLGVHDVIHHGQVLRRLHLFACRNLR